MKYVVTYVETLAMLLINLSIYVVLKLYRVYITLLVINYLRGGDTHIRMHTHTHTHTQAYKHLWTETRHAGAHLV